MKRLVFILVLLFAVQGISHAQRLFPLGTAGNSKVYALDLLTADSIILPPYYSDTLAIGRHARRVGSQIRVAKTAGDTIVYVWNGTKWNNGYSIRTSNGEVEILRNANTNGSAINTKYILQNSSNAYSEYARISPFIRVNTAGAQSGAIGWQTANSGTVDYRGILYEDGSLILQNGGTYTKTAGIGLDVLTGAIRVNAFRPVTISSGAVTIQMDGGGGWAGGMYTKPSSSSASEGLIGTTGGTTTTSHIWIGGNDPANPWIRIDKQTVDASTKFRILNGGEIYMYAGAQVFAGNFQVASGRTGLGGAPDGTHPLKVYGAVLTAQASATGAGAWKLGKYTTGSALTVQTTKWIEVEIDGTLRRLAIVE